MKLMLIGIAAVVVSIVLTSIASKSVVTSGQSRADSLREAWTNIAVGFTINYIANLLIFPLVSLHIGLGDNFWIGGSRTGARG